jgi:enoyl-CoA hydratase/carnithine racemase
MAIDEVRVTREGALLEITIARPKTKNALSLVMYQALTEAFETATTDESVLAVLIRGEGGNFSSGNDLKDFLEFPPKGHDAPVFKFMHAIALCPKPVIAAVDGFAVGIGTTMLLHCDLVYAADDAKFVMPFTSLALVPEAGSSYLLPRTLGHRRTSELLFFGEPFDTKTAYEAGLVSKILPAAELHAHAKARALALTKRSPSALRETKRLLLGHERAAMLAQLDHEADTFSSMLGTPEVVEAISAFFEKRAPDFQKLR